MRWLILVAGLAIVTHEVRAQSCPLSTGEPVHVRSTALKAEALLNYSDINLLIYVMGVVDGMLLLPVVGAPKHCFDAMFEKCMKGRTVTQQVAIVRKYLNDSPNVWHESANGIVWKAILQSCKYSICPQQFLAWYLINCGKEEGLSRVIARRAKPDAAIHALFRKSGLPRRTLRVLLAMTNALDRTASATTLNTRIQELPMPTSVRLDRELEARLDRLAEKTGRTKAYYIRRIIENGIEDMEDIYLADQAYERIQQGLDKVIDAQEVYRELGIEV